MIKFTKDDFSTKAELDSEIENYRKWTTGELKGANPLNRSFKEIHSIVMNKEAYSYEDKTRDELRQAEALEKEKKAEEDHKTDLNKWLNKVVRPQRDQKINDVLWLFQRHERENKLNLNTTLTDAQIDSLYVYVQSLADFTNNLQYQKDIQWPSKPSFI